MFTAILNILVTSASLGFYRKVVDDLHTRLGVRREDVFINLIPAA